MRWDMECQAWLAAGEPYDDDYCDDCEGECRAQWVEGDLPLEERPRVTRLHRMDPSPAQQGWWYYSPDGYCIGPFASEAEREGDVREFYEEIPFDSSAPL